MSGQRQPIQVVMANGKKHLTKAEIEERMNSEPTPCTDDMTAPSYLSAAEKKRYNKLAEQLSKLKVMGETDTETLARYVSAQGLYEQAVKDLRAAQRDRPRGRDVSVEELARWASVLNTLDKRVDRYFKQATMAAGKLGLTITDRCKLVVPKAPEAPKQNKFVRFNQGAG